MKCGEPLEPEWCQNWIPVCSCWGSWNRSQLWVFFQNNLYVLLLPQPSLHSHQQGLNASVFKYFIKIKILERLCNSVYLSFCFGLFIVFFLQDNTMWSQRKKWEERGGAGAGKRPQAWIHTWVTRSAFCLPCRPTVLSPTGAVFFFFI